MAQQRQQASWRIWLESSTPGRVGDQWQVNVTAILMQGRNALAGENIQFYVDAVSDGLSVTTDGNGRAQKIVIIPADRQRVLVSAQLVGRAITAGKEITVPRETPPQMELEVGNPQKVGDQWQAVATVNISQHQRPLAGANVEFSVAGNPQGAPMPTNANGRAQQVLTFPLRGGNFNVTAQVVNTTTRTNAVVEIPRVIQLPPNSIKLEADGNLGLYTLRAVVTDETGKGSDCPVIFSSLRGASDPSRRRRADGNYPPYLNEKEVNAASGIATIQVEFLARWMTFMACIKDRPGIRAELKLRGPKRVQLPTLTDAQVGNLGFWGMVKDGIREGRRFAKERKKRSGRQ